MFKIECWQKLKNNQKIDFVFVFDFDFDFNLTSYYSKS